MLGGQFAGAAERAAGRLAEIGEGRPGNDLRFALAVNAQVEDDLAVAAVEAHDLSSFHFSLRERTTSSSARWQVEVERYSPDSRDQSLPAVAGPTGDDVPRFGLGATPSRNTGGITFFRFTFFLATRGSCKDGFLAMSTTGFEPGSGGIRGFRFFRMACLDGNENVPPRYLDVAQSPKKPPAGRV